MIQPLPIHWSVNGVSPKEVNTAGLDVREDVRFVPADCWWPAPWTEVSPEALLKFGDAEFIKVARRCYDWAYQQPIDTRLVALYDTDGRLPASGIGLGVPPTAYRAALKRLLASIHTPIAEIRAHIAVTGTLMLPFAWRCATAAEADQIRNAADDSEWYYDEISPDLIVSEWYEPSHLSTAVYQGTETATTYMPPAAWLALGPITAHLRDCERIRQRCGVGRHLSLVMVRAASPGADGWPRHPVALPREHLAAMMTHARLTGVDGLVPFDNTVYGFDWRDDFKALWNGSVQPAWTAQ